MSDISLTNDQKIMLAIDHNVEKNEQKISKVISVVLDYCKAMVTYSRIAPLRSYGNLQ